MASGARKREDDLERVGLGELLLGDRLLRPGGIGGGRVDRVAGLRVGKGLVEGDSPVLRSVNPRDRASPIRPIHPVPADVAQLRERKRGAGERDVDRFEPHARDRRDPRIVPLGERGPAPVGGDHRVVGQGPPEVDAAIRPVELHRGEHGLVRHVRLAARFVLDVENAFAVGREDRPRHGANLSPIHRADHVVARAALRRHPVDFEPQFIGEIVITKRGAASSEEHDPLPVRGIGGVGVLARRLREPARGSAGGRDRPDVPAVPVVPGDERDPLAVARKGGSVLDVGKRREPPRRAVRQCHRVEMPHRGEDEPLAVRRFDRPADHARAERGAAEVVGEAERLGEALLDGGGERNGPPLAGGDVPTPDLSLRRGHDRAPVGSPGVPGERPVGTEALLVVSLDVLRDGPKASGREVHEFDPRLGPHAAHERE